MIAVDGKALFEEEIAVFNATTRKYPFPKANGMLFKSHGDELIDDDFDHELIIVFGKESRFIFTGCGHNGLLNILESVIAEGSGEIACVMGGFHLLDNKNGLEYETAEEIVELGEKLKSRFPSTSFITGHCTGDNAFNYLKSILGEQLKQFYVGYELSI